MELPVVLLLVVPLTSWTIAAVETVVEAFILLGLLFLVVPLFVAEHGYQIRIIFTLVPRLVLSRPVTLLLAPSGSGRRSLLFINHLLQALIEFLQLVGWVASL